MLVGMEDDHSRNTHNWTPLAAAVETLLVELRGQAEPMDNRPHPRSVRIEETRRKTGWKRTLQRTPRSAVAGSVTIPKR